MILETANEVRATSSFIMWGVDGKAFTGQFILHTVIGGEFFQAAKFVTCFNGEYVYMNVKGNNVFKDGAEFINFLNANEHGEVFGKATFTKAGNITSPEWTLTLG